MKWGEAYTKWLRRRGVPIAEIGIHVRVASRIVAEAGGGSVEPKHVYQARATALSQGSSSAQLESFDTLAAVFMEFQSELKSAGAGDRAPPATDPPSNGAIDLGAPPEDAPIDLGAAPEDGAIDLGAPSEDAPIDLGAAPEDGAIDLDAPPDRNAPIDLGAAPEQPANDLGVAPEIVKPKQPRSPWVNAEPSPDSAAPATPQSPATSPTPAPAPAAATAPASPPRDPVVRSRAGTARTCRHCGGATTIDYGQQNLAISAILIAVVGAAMGFFLGVIGATALILFGAAIAAGIGISLAAYRCTACGSLVEAERQSPTEADQLKATRRRLAAATGISAVGGVVMAVAWFLASSVEVDPREALLVSTVQAVAHRIDSDRNLRRQAERFDPELRNESVIMTFYSAEYSARAPTPPEGIGICQYPPERPFCVVVRPGSGAHSIVVEGYGDDRETIIAREALEIWPH